MKAEPLVIVENGQPRAAIVVAADEPKAANAAAEIQKYVEKMSGAKLPIVKEGDPVKAPISILVGHTTAAQKLGVKIPSGFNPTICADANEEEGYVLMTKGNSLIVGGNSDGQYQGTLYAAYALLEKLGCRWYFPGEWGEVIPRQKTINVPDLQVKSKPDFAIRSVWLSGWLPTSKDEHLIYVEWGARIGMTTKGDSMYPTVGDGYLGNLLPPDEYRNTHPEFYAMNKNGRRELHKNAKGQFSPQHAMFCLSNPAVLAESIKNLKACFEGKRRIRIADSNGIGLSPPDGAPFCYCDQCLAANQNFYFPTRIGERMQSEEFFGFISKLAKEFPGKYFSTYAYSLRELPPQGMKLPPNVMVKLAPISCCALHGGNDPACWRRQEMIRTVRQWRRLTPHLVLRDYDPHLLTGVFVPENEAAVIAANIPIYKEIGIKGMAREGRKVFMQTWISYYLTSKLLWNSKTDVATIKKDFYEKFFGPDAGPPIQAWWDACENALTQATVHIHEDWLLNHVYTADFVKSIRPNVESARKAAMTDVQRKRFDAFALIADHLEAYAAMHAAEKNLDFAVAAKEADRMLEIKKKIQAVNPFLYTFGERREQRNTFTLGHKDRYEKLAAFTDGRKGRMVAPLPLEMNFMRDRFNEGVIAEWYAPGFDDRNWGKHSTFNVWNAQEPPEDAAGHDYDGYGWYRAVVKVPAEFAGKPVHLWLGGAINEGWVWINGDYAGHKPFTPWWTKTPDYDLDVTSMVKAGKDNVVAIRLWNDADVGGLYRRAFFWSPKESVNPVKTDSVPSETEPPPGVE
ncbi:MAG: DUF4838 domain-containing protein [Verrucomicrobia bacterium]|nr:DUF4838 domain-containing protein [Verrucomicrobiota bacterium]